MLKFFRKIDLTGYTVIVPSVCVGNVAQLSADLFIATLTMEKVAQLWHPAIIPIFGPAAFKHDTHNTTTAAELYACEAKKVAVLQIRSPLVGGLLDTFIEELTTALAGYKLTQLIVLTGSFAHEKHFIGANPFEYMADDRTKSKFDNPLRELEWTECTSNVIHGGGYAKRLMAKLVAHDIACLLLFKYVSEGDNTSDAIHLSSYLDKLLNLLPQKEAKTQSRFCIPISWAALYGNDAPREIYY